MFSNFFKTALRNIFRHKTYVIINILGLAISFACSLLIFLFVIHELSFDKFNEKYDRIYRLNLVGKMGESEFSTAYTAAPAAKAFLEEFPEVEAAVRMQSWGESLIRIDDRKFIENKIALADSSFFDIFSLKLLKGNPKKALAEPNAVVLTEKQSEKYFGNTDPLGKHLRIGSDTTLYTITGVMENVPENSHFEFDMLISFMTSPRANDDFWLSNSFATYILLREGVAESTVEDKIPEIIKKYVGPQVEKVLQMDLQAFIDAGNRYGIFMQPLSDIHTNPEITGDFKQARDRKYIFIFSGIALLIIIVAGINYMNLSTARSTKRSREVGLRKVVGSTRGLLIRQFILESLILTFISLILAIILVELMLPFFNNLLQTDLTVGYFSRWYVIPGIVALTLLVGFLSGSYPAWFLASFIPIKALQGKLKLGATNVRLRSVLVVFQFLVSIFLIMSSFVIYKQIHYMINKDMGFDKEQLLVISRTDGLNKKIKSFKEEILKIPSVVNITNSTAVPGYPNNNNGFQMEGKSADQSFLMWVNWVDYDYLNTYRIKLADGRAFSQDFASDTANVIINQEAVRRFGLTDPYNVRFIQPGRNPGEKYYYNVIGVCSNFHHASLRSEIEPHVFMIKPEKWDWTGFITIRLNKDHMKQTIASIEKVWDKFTSDEPLQYFFLDKEFETFYKEERQTAKIAVAFSILAILIASLGLFGLTSFATEQRAREISLRKVLGSSAQGIVYLFNREFSFLILIAAVPAGFLSYFLMNKWLENFKYHVSVGFMEFLLSIFIVLIVAFITVSVKTYKAAQTNPAEVLKYE